jgi:isopenicillin-N epimerase
MTPHGLDCSGASPLAALWDLDPRVAMLNHGSFGACPRAVLDAQARFRRQMEREPVRFFLHEMEPLLDASRAALAALVGADPADLAFVRNATVAVNSVLRSLEFGPGDEILVTNHAYNACRNVVDYVASRAGARVVCAPVPFPIGSPREVLDAVLGCAGDRTRLALVDHITSPTAIVFPIAELVRRLDERGIDTLVDGAHAPGMVPLDLRALGAAYVTGNCHKWLCAPKGAGYLYVRPDRQSGLHPAVLSHGYNMRRPGRNRLHEEFDWTGTDDPTPWLCVAEAIRFLDSLPGGLPQQMRRNHALAVQARRVLCDALGIGPPCPDEMLGAMAAVPLPDDPDGGAREMSIIPSQVHPLQRRLLDEFGIEVPVYYWPGSPKRLLRISAQAYNGLDQYRRLAAALGRLLG